MKKRTKKLSLNKESIRSLNATTLDRIVGGRAAVNPTVIPKSGQSASIDRDDISGWFC